MNHSVIIIPTYNEADNIENLIRQILGLKIGLDILVVDDNSSDGTGKIIDYLSNLFDQVKVMHRPKKMGLGTAYLAAFRQVTNQGYEYIIDMDGDFSHDPKYIPDFLDKIKDYDLVLGSRYIDGINIINWSFFRLLLSIFANKYVKLVTGLPFSDPLGGFRCFRKGALEHIIGKGIISKGYIFQAEALYRLYKRGCRIAEIPITFVDRGLGKTKLSGGIVLEALFKAAILRLKT